MTPTPDDDYMICLVQGLFEYRRISEWRIMQGADFKLRKRPIPDLNPGEVLAVKPGESLCRIVKRED